MILNDPMQKMYEEAFDREYANLMLRKAADPDFTREYLAGLLQSLYINQGNNHMDRTEAKEKALQAMIAACETMLSEWE